MQWLSRFDISDTAIITVKNVGYRCIIHNIRFKNCFIENYVLKNH